MDSFRTRSRVVNPDRAYLHYTRKDSSGNVGRESHDSQTYLGKYEWIYDENHPGFERRSDSGEIIVGPLTLSRVENFASDGHFTFPEGDSIHEFTGDMFSAFNRTAAPNLSFDRSSLLASLQARAAVSALKKLNTAEVDMGENLATLGQTVATFRRPFSAFFKQMSKMERIRAKKMTKGGRAASWTKATSSTWLEYSFGIRPVLQDIGTVSKMVADNVELIQNAVKVARGSSSGRIFGSNTDTYVHGGEMNPMNGTIAEGTLDTVTKVKVGCGVYYKTPLGNMNSFLARRLGLGVNNLPSSAWNLLPHSWFVDQFVQVGDWIQALTPDPDLIILQKWMTEVDVTETTGMCTLKVHRAKGSGTPTWYTGNCGVWKSQSLTVNRVLTFDLPSYPQFNPQLGYLAQAVNNAAYLSQMALNLLKRWH